MTAREDLIWRCMQAGLSKEWATRQVDNFAHELADQIREGLGAGLGRADADRAALVEARMRERARQAAIDRVRDALATFDDRGVIRPGYTNFDIPTAGEAIDAVRRALDGVPTSPAATPADDDELVHVGWYCWRADGHLATQACRSDNVPIHVPRQWADDMRREIQRHEDEPDEEQP